MLSFGHGRLMMPVADGTISTADRAHLLGLYAGIALDTGATYPSVHFAFRPDRPNYTIATERADTTFRSDRPDFSAKPPNP